MFAQALPKDQFKDSLLQSLDHPKDDTSKINALFSLATLYASNDSATASAYANQCLQLSQQINWQKGIGNYYLAKAKIAEEVTDFSASIEYSKKAFDILKPLNQNSLLVRVLLTISVGYGRSGIYTKSIEYCLQALKLAEAINSKTLISVAYNNLGLNYQYLQEPDKAIANYEKALSIAKRENYKIMIASDFGNIANVFEFEKKYDSSKAYNLQAIAAYKDIDNLPGLDRTYNDYANVLVKLNDMDSALAFYNRSLEISKKLGIKDDISSTYGNVGNMYLKIATDSSSDYKIPPALKMSKEKLLQQSKYYLTQAISLGIETNDMEVLKDYYNNLSETESQLGNYKDGLAFYKKYNDYKDSIFNDKNKQKIAALETDRLTETKDHEIALQASETKRQSLLKRVVLISAILIFALIGVFVLFYNRRKKIRFDKEVMEVEMKALRAQMNPHFISNALHSINKYVMDNDKKNASAYLAKFASLMRLILENSREQEVPLEQDLHALELYMELEMMRFKNSFTYQINVDPLIDIENTLIPPMLLQPFAENAILHGLHNKENGNINIQVSKVKEMICCIVEDNGNGSITEPAPTSDENKQHKSLGKKIINERLSIINRLKKAKASVNIFQVKDAENKPGGIRVELILPLELAF